LSGNVQLGACFTSNVIRFASDFFVHFAGFEGEYSKYLTEKRVKWAEKGDVKMVTGLVKQAPSSGRASPSPTALYHIFLHFAIYKFTQNIYLHPNN